MCVLSVWILILVSQFCLGLRAVSWNADLWRCHHSSMSLVSALPPSLILLFMQLWWHALFFTDSSGQLHSCPALLTFSDRNGKLLDILCCCLQITKTLCPHFSPFPNLYTLGQTCDDHADNLWFLHLLYLSCDTVTQCSPFHRRACTVAPHWSFSL